MAPIHPAIVLTVAVVASLTFHCATPCERRTEWRNEHSAACQNCQRTHCADPIAALQRVPMTCQSEYACVARCPAGSATTCNCIETCLTTEACRTAYDALVACQVRHCDRECHAGMAPTGY